MTECTAQELIDNPRWAQSFMLEKIRAAIAAPSDNHADNVAWTSIRIFQESIEKQHAHRLAEKIRNHQFPEWDYDELFGVGQGQAADLIDPEVT